MRILCIGDTHFKTNNIKESYEFINKLENYIKENINNIQYIIALGDILDKHEIVHTQALNVALDFFKMLTQYLPKRVSVLVGNHDYINNNNFLNTNHWMNSLKNWGNINIVDNIYKLDIDNDHYCLLSPFVPDGRFVEALITSSSDWTNARIIFGHQLLNGVKMGAHLAENVEEWKDDYPLLISGHIHNKQKIKSNLYYTGSSMQHAFGETDDKTLAIVDTQDLNIEEIDLELSRKRIIYIDAVELDSKLDSLIIKPNEQVKLVVSGDEEFFKKYKNSEQIKQKLENKGISKMVFKTKERNKFEGKEEIVKRQNDFLELLDYITKEKKDESIVGFYEHIVYGKTDPTDIANMLIL